MKAYTQHDTKSEGCCKLQTPQKTTCTEVVLKAGSINTCLQMYFLWNVYILLKGGKKGERGVKYLNKMLQGEKALATLGTQELEKLEA